MKCVVSYSHQSWLLEQSVSETRLSYQLQTAIDYRIGEHETGWELLGDYLALDYAVKLRSDHFETVSREPHL